MAELCLGTAQLGMQYGINNKVGKLQKESVFEILDTAIGNNIRIWDTASIYGDAEALLGEYLTSHSDTTKDVKIISKQCQSVDDLNRKAIEKCIREELQQSLERLHREYLDGYLLHSYREINNSDTIRILQELKTAGFVKAIGVSVYEIDEAETAIESGNIDYLQMPCSIFDQRGLTSGVFQKAKERGITVFTRSVFVQGLLMMKEEEIPDYLSGIIPYVSKFNQILSEYKVERKHAVLKYILSQDLIDYMVFGVETKEQLEEIVQETKAEMLPLPFAKEIQECFSDISTELILPINWKGVEL
ncbi:MAG: aldo/keto reductase [Lachnospiraceae bacterium]|nr:aldo/keto reductase [Lachnospiraceae bacterium]